MNLPWRYSWCSGIDARQVFHSLLDHSDGCFGGGVSFLLGIGGGLAFVLYGFLGRLMLLRGVVGGIWNCTVLDVGMECSSMAVLVGSWSGSRPVVLVP